MIYLLDVDTLLSSDRAAYPIAQFQPLWDWIIFQAEHGNIKIIEAQYEEAVSGINNKDVEILSWLKENKSKLVVESEVDIKNIQDVISKGYSSDLDDSQIEKIGSDPLLIAEGLNMHGTIVSIEVSSPMKTGHDSRIPDVCKKLKVPCLNMYQLIKNMNFNCDWEKNI